MLFIAFSVYSFLPCDHQGGRRGPNLELLCSAGMSLLRMALWRKRLQWIGCHTRLHLHSATNYYRRRNISFWAVWLPQDVWLCTVNIRGELDWVQQVDMPLVDWWVHKRTGKGERKDMWMDIIIVFSCILKLQTTWCPIQRGRQPTIIQIISREHEALKTAGLFRREVFGFPPLILTLLLE
jgi:hypothetical protein